MKTSIYTLTIILFFTLPVRAKNTSTIGMTTYLSHFSDLSLSDGQEEIELPDSLQVELTFRFQAIFNLMLSAGKFLHDEESDIGTLAAKRNSFSLGFKVDLPGVFFVGTENFARRQGKKWPFNSFLYGAITRVSTENISGSTDSSMATHYGLGFDIFLFNQVVYLSFYAGGFQFETNTFLHTAGGIGVTF